MQEILQEFGEITGFKGVVVFGSDGLVIEGNWPGANDTDFLAANLADLTAMINQIFKERLKQEEFDFLTIDVSDKKLFIKKLNPFTFLTVLTQSDAKPGLILLELNEKIKKLREVL